jgi:predicted DNA-binding protein YlxM (UPF0122 family)
VAKVANINILPDKREIEKKLHQTLLYDFYGDILTPHQKKVYEDFVLNDLSLTEIAEEENISRQGVHDLVKRCDRILEELEEKLSMIERFKKTKNQLEQIHDLTMEYGNQESKTILEQIRTLSREMMEEL